jgi:hypothetical protein
MARKICCWPFWGDADHAHRCPDQLALRSCIQCGLRASLKIEHGDKPLSDEALREMLKTRRNDDP